MGFEIASGCFNGGRMRLLLGVFDTPCLTDLGRINGWLRVGGMGNGWLVMGEVGCRFVGSLWFCIGVEVGCWFGRRRGAEGWRSGRRLWWCGIWVFVRWALRMEVWVCNGLTGRVVGLVYFAVAKGLWCGSKTFWVLEVWRFGSTVALIAIWRCDRTAVLWWLLVNIGLQVWIDVESGGCRLVSVVLLGFWFWKGGPSTLVLLRLRILASSSELVVFWFIVLLFCSFLLVLCFGSDFRSQINLCSFESRLLSRTLAGVRFWENSPLFLGPRLLPAASRVIAYQPVMNTLTLMSVENARKGYPKGRPDQLCYLLANMAQSSSHFRSRLNPLTSQFLLFRVRIFSSSLLEIVLWMYSLSWDCNCYCNC